MSLKEHQNIQEFLSGDISDDKRKEFVRKFNSQKNKRVKEMTRSKNNFDAQNAWTKLHDRLEEDGLLTDKKQRTIKLNYISKIAASVILVLGLTISAYFIFQTERYIEYASNENLKELVLPDGSVVTLNENSTIKYPKKFRKKLRKVEFSGEAFFDIKRNPEMPFVIHTNDANVKVLGTSFNLLSKGSNTELTVTSGKVSLSRKHDLSEQIVLEVGDKGLLVNNKLMKETNKDINYLAWKTKEFNFYDMSLEQVFADLEKVYKTDIIIEDAKIGELKFISNKSLKNYDLDTIFEIILTIHPLKKEIREGKIYISE
jgi:ferric-dicitrate binding protein FerR (iron transport regulator)